MDISILAPVHTEDKSWLTHVVPSKWFLMDRFLKKPIDSYTKHAKRLEIEYRKTLNDLLSSGI